MEYRDPLKEAIGELLDVWNVPDGRNIVNKKVIKLNNLWNKLIQYHESHHLLMEAYRRWLEFYDYWIAHKIVTMKTL